MRPPLQAEASGDEPVTAPTDTTVKVYRYGLLPPTELAQHVSDQIHAAHKYHNTLIEIERSRRQSVRAVQLTYGDVEAMANRVAELEADLGRVIHQIRATRSKAKARADTPEQREMVVAARAALKVARLEFKTARHAAIKDPDCIAAMIGVTNAHKERARQARAACGVYWGTYLQVEQAMDAARKSMTEPRFRRWTGRGAVAVQLQGGLPVIGALACEDTRFRIDTTARPVPGRGNTGAAALPRVHLRVGSVGRAPVWAEWPLIYGSAKRERELPEGAVIKWAKVVRDRVASHDRWSLHLTIEIPTPEPTPARPGSVVAVDLGWRKVGDTLRSGGWADDTGRVEGILMAPDVIKKLARSESLRSIRDGNQNEMHAWLIAWREAHLMTLPLEHGERMERLPMWKSPARFAALAIWWRANRTDGDAEMYERLEAWRKQDKHLWNWEAFGRRSALLQRRDGCRVLAARLAREYETLVIERLDLRAMALIPAPESEKESHPVARAQRFAAAPSELRMALVQAFQSRRRKVVTVPPQGPSTALLAAYRERSGVEEKVVTARVSRFKKLRGPGPATTSTPESGE